MDTKDEGRRLVCVLFPGIVKNDEKALQCLGGTKGLSEVYSNVNKKRLGLTFQPDNPYVNKIYADVSKRSGVLLKVRVKKTKTDNGIKREVLSTNVVGRVVTVFKFDGMGDFQYLPVHKEEDEKAVCIREQILPTELTTVDFMMQSAVPYLTPSLYTRTDRPWPYQYTYKKSNIASKEANKALTPNLILAKPPHPTIVTFSLTDKFPNEASEHHVITMERKTKQNLKPAYEAIVKALEERPMWSMNAIVHHTGLRRIVVRFILPALAFYFNNGPWRKVWSKYGYDPRKEPNARLYQVLDFRVRGELSSKVSLRNVEKRVADSVGAVGGGGGGAPHETVSEGSVIFRPGVQLTQRQIFYHFCDIKIPEVEDMLSEEPAPGALCHPVHGWLSHTFYQTCRDHVVRYSKETLIASHVADLKYENPSSEDEQNSDEDQDYTEASTSAVFDETNT